MLSGFTTNETTLWLMTDVSIKARQFYLAGFGGIYTDTPLWLRPRSAQRMPAIYETPRHRTSCAGGQSLGLAITFIVIGILAFIFSSVAIGFVEAVGPVSHSFSGGTDGHVIAAHQLLLLSVCRVRFVVHRKPEMT